jgi:hypothetical protein
MLQFVARQNVERCRSRLKTETDPTTRAFLLKLLVEEEDKLGLDYQLLGDVEREIINGHARITHKRSSCVTWMGAGTARWRKPCWRRLP